MKIFKNDSQKNNNKNKSDEDADNDTEINRKKIGNDLLDDLNLKLEDFKTLQKKTNETTQQFLFRAKLFFRVYDDTKDEEKALKISNIWVNILSLNCTYQNDLMIEIEKYRPSDDDNIYFRTEDRDCQ